MRRLLRVVLILSLGLAVLAAAGVVYLYVGLPKQQIVADIAGRLQTETGREVRIDGTPQVVLWPRPGIRTGPVSISNPGWASDPNLVASQSGLITISFEGLLAGELRIGALHLQGGRASLERRADGTANWPWMGGAQTAALDELRLEPEVLDLRDPFLAAPVRLHDVDLQAQFSTSAQTATIQATYRTKDEALGLELRIGQLGEFFAGAWSRVALTATGPGVELDWLGKAAIRPDQPYPYFEGRLDGAGEGLARFAQLLGLPVGLSARLGLSELKLDADLVLHAERLRLRGFASGQRNGRGVSLDIRLKGGADWQRSGLASLNLVSRAAGVYSAYLDGEVTLGKTPQADLALKASVIDLAALRDLTGLVVPRGKAIPQTANIAGGFRYRHQEIVLEDAILRLDSDMFPGGARLALGGARPHLTIDAKLERLDISRYLALGPRTRRLSPPRPQDWPDNGLDLSLDLEAKELILGGATAANSRVQAHFRPDAVAYSIPRMVVFGGEISAEALVDGADPPLLAASVRFSKLNTRALLGALRGASPVAGAAAGDFRFSTRGARLASADGTGSLSVFGGTLEGLDLVALARGVEPGDGVTPFAVFSTNIALREGVLQLSRAELSGGAFELGGDMLVDLVNDTVSGQLVPVPKEGEALHSIALGGTIAAIEGRTIRDQTVSAPPGPDGDGQEAVLDQPGLPSETPVAASEDTVQLSEGTSALADAAAAAASVPEQSPASEQSEDNGPRNSPIPLPAPR